MARGARRPPRAGSRARRAPTRFAGGRAARRAPGSARGPRRSCAALRSHVRLSMDGGDDVRAGCVGRRDTFARDRREAQRCVGHHVADHLDMPCRALVAQRRRRSLVGAEQQRCEPVDLDPGALLGHRQVAAPKARLDVRERGAGLAAARAPASVEFVSPRTSTTSGLSAASTAAMGGVSRSTSAVRRSSRWAGSSR